MNLTDILNEADVINDEISEKKNAALQSVSKLLSVENKIDKKLIYENFQKREFQASTGMVKGIAIPHALMKQMSKTNIKIIRLKNKIDDWEMLDDSLTECLIVLTGPTPTEQNNEHLKLLSSFSRLLMDDEFIKVLKFGTYEDIVNRMEDLS